MRHQELRSLDRVRLQTAQNVIRQSFEEFFVVTLTGGAFVCQMAEGDSLFLRRARFDTYAATGTVFNIYLQTILQVRFLDALGINSNEGGGCSGQICFCHQFRADNRMRTRH